MFIRYGLYTIMSTVIMIRTVYIFSFCVSVWGSVGGVEHIVVVHALATVGTLEALLAFKQIGMISIGSGFSGLNNQCKRRVIRFTLV